MKVEEVAFENLTVEELMELAQNGAKAIVDGDKKVLRMIREDELDTLETKLEVLLEHVK